MFFKIKHLYLCVNQTQRSNMKKFILSILALGTIVTAQAQAPKAGSVLIYGNVGLSVNKTDYDPGVAGTNAYTVSKETRFNFNPGIGYQVNKNWTVGVNFGLSTDKDEDSSEFALKTRDFEVGPFIRHTLCLNKTFFLYNQVNLSYLNGRILKEDFVDNENTYNGFGASWAPGLGVSVNNMIALNFQIGGMNFMAKSWDIDASPATETQSSFNMTLGQQASIGISLNIGGRSCCSKEPGSDMRHMDSKEESED